MLDVLSDKCISGEKLFMAKLQLCVGIPLLIDSEVIRDLCANDRSARDTVEFKQVEVLNVLRATVSKSALVQWCCHHLEPCPSRALMASARENIVRPFVDSVSFSLSMAASFLVSCARSFHSYDQDSRMHLIC